MTITQEQLAERLREAREAAGLTQEQVAAKLNLSRPTIVQMEQGRRSVTSLELGQLAWLYGRDMRSFFGEAFRPQDALAVLFRADPALSDEADIADHLRWCMAVARELSNLESLLEIEDGQAAPARYDLAPPASRGQAINQGSRIAAEERKRLDIGDAAIADVAELLESQGVRAMTTPLPEDISGLTAHEQASGAVVAINRRHPVLRRRFSYAHEYAHVLLDRDRMGTVSRISQNKELLEVRANAFAAAFLMPDRGIRRFIESLGKGRGSRSVHEIGDGDSFVRGEARYRPGSQDIQIYDVVHVAHAFGVSTRAALYRLGNLKPSIISVDERNRLMEMIERRIDVEARNALGLPEPERLYESHDQIRHRVVALGLDAYRQELITRAKLVDIGALVQVDREALDRLIHDAGLDDD